jgi:AAA domain
MIKPSKEQKNIIESTINKKNIVVNAVAGSGKTTTLLLLGNKMKHKKILQVTYNKQLKNEVRKKVDELNLNNVDIQTYHGLAVKFYSPNAHTDDNMAKILKSDMKIRYRPQYDIIVIDEVQDMTPNYYELIFKFMQDIGYRNNILILGDSYQSVYEFKNADTRFLLFSHQLWEKDSFEQLSLRQSYRMTTQISSFVNKVMLGHDRILSQKKGEHPVYYYRTNIFKNINETNEIFHKIVDLLNSGYKYDDFFILSPSLKGLESPCKKLENILVKNNIPVFFTRNEEDGIDDQVISGKVVFTTFHQSKGRERKIVFIFGFDESYFDLYATEKNKMVCPPELYVAATRASEILVIVENDKYHPLPFLKKPACQIKKYSFVKYISDSDTKKEKKKKKKKDKTAISHNTTVKNLTMYLSEVTINEIAPMMDILFSIVEGPQNETTINIPSTIKTSNNLTEDVSDLNGIVIPAIYEKKITNERSSLEKIIDQYSETSENNNNDIVTKKLAELNDYDNDSKRRYLLMGNIYIAMTENIYCKLNQIDKYKWLKQNMIDICFKNLENNVANNAKYEQTIYHNSKNYFTFEHDIYGDINISGRVDAYDDKYLWEFKCVSTLTLEHLLQLLIYAWIWENCECTNKKYRILNIRTGEVRELNYQSHMVNAIIELIFINKYDQKFKDSDQKFLEKCNKMRDKYEIYDDDVFGVFDIKIG